MRVLLAMLLAFTALACDKTIHECRLDGVGDPATLTAIASASAPAPAGR
jgi:hypothetical protein